MRNVTLALSLSLLVASSALAEDVLLTRKDSPIRAVTVYSAQALVKREAAFNAAAQGPLKLTVARLPPRIRDDSVRVRAGANLVLLGSRIVATPVAESSQPEVEELNAQLRKVKAEWEVINDEKWVVEQTIAQVRAISDAHAKETAGGGWATGTLTAIPAMVEWAAKTLTDAVKTKRAAQDKLTEIERQARLLEARIKELTVNAGYEKDLEIDLDARATGALKVEIEYVTEGASWAPAYDLRADSDAKAIDVTYIGVVKQQTGEGWDGVRLALSTARPELGARPPELLPWWMRMQPRRPARSGSFGGAAPGAPAARTVAEAPEETLEGALAAHDRTITAEPEQRGATVAFNIQVPETIPSDGKPKRTTIGRASFKAENRYFAAPKLAPFAYLRATVTNGFAYPMLAGEANVFFGPDFVGRAKVDLVPPGEKTDVYLGVDERVKVERKTEKRFRDTKGLITTDVRERFEFRNLVKNNRDVPIQITILDQIPVSQDEDIKIEDVSFSQDPTEKEEKKGEMRWNLGLAPKGETNVLVGFTVRFPEKREGEVVGIER